MKAEVLGILFVAAGALWVVVYILGGWLGVGIMLTISGAGEILIMWAAARDERVHREKVERRLEAIHRPPNPSR